MPRVSRPFRAKHIFLANPGLKPMSAKIIVRRFDRRMAFVSEGQADSSQARNAWVAMQRGPVPEERLPPSEEVVLTPI
jgi:hypothetical protein